MAGPFIQRGERHVSRNTLNRSWCRASERKFSKQGLTFEKNHMVGALFYHLLQAFSPNTA